MTQRSARILAYRVANGSPRQRQKALKRLAQEAARGCTIADEWLCMFHEFIDVQSGGAKPILRSRRA